MDTAHEAMTKKADTDQRVMPKRNGPPEGADQGGEGGHKKPRTEVETDEETRFAAREKEWKDMQPVVDTLREYKSSRPCGIVSLSVVVKNSLLAHKEKMEEAGYDYYAQAHDRSLFERFMREVQPAMNGGCNIGSVVLDQLHGFLEAVNTGSKPEKGIFSMLVIMEAKYIKPIADMIYLVTSSYSVVEDLDLVWELLERAWCFGHPVFKGQSSQYLDDVCQRISKRKDEAEGECRKQHGRIAIVPEKSLLRLA